MTDTERPAFKLGNLPIPNGTILTMGIRYEGTDEPGGDTRGRTNPKVYTYAMVKAGGLWYVTGSGKVPQAAGWGAIERWLGKDGRVVEWVRVVTEEAPLYPAPGAPEAARIVAVLAAQVDTSQAGPVTSQS